MFDWAPRAAAARETGFHGGRFGGAPSAGLRGLGRIGGGDVVDDNATIGQGEVFWEQPQSKNRQAFDQNLS